MTKCSKFINETTGNIKSQLKEAIKSRILIGLVPPLNLFFLPCLSLFFLFFSPPRATVLKKVHSECVQCVVVLERKPLIYVLCKICLYVKAHRGLCCVCCLCLLSPAEAPLPLWLHAEEFQEVRRTASTRFYYNTSRSSSSRPFTSETLTRAVSISSQLRLFSVYALERSVNCVSTVALMHQFI